MNHWIFGLKIATIVGFGLVAGVFLAFSTFVMPAFAKIPPAQGIAAMQSVNVAVMTSLFMAIFMSAGAVCLFFAGYALKNWGASGAGWLLAGSLMYLIGTFAVTIAFNVPLNDGLAKLNPASPESVLAWNHYLSSWTLWNHVRTAFSTGSMLCFLLSLAQRPNG